MKRVYLTGDEYGHFYKGGNVYLKIGYNVVLHTARPNKEKGRAIPLRIDAKLASGAYVAEDAKAIIINDNVVFLALVKPRSIANIVPKIRDTKNNSIELDFDGAIVHIQTSNAQETGFKSPYLCNKYVLEYVQELQAKRLAELEGYRKERETEIHTHNIILIEYKDYLKSHSIEVECEIMMEVKTASHRSFKDDTSIIVEVTNVKYFTVNGEKVFLKWLVGDPSKSHKMAYDVSNINAHYGIDEKKAQMAKANQIYSYRGSYFIVVEQNFCKGASYGFSSPLNSIFK